MRCVPVRMAWSAITREEEREVGGLGAGGAMEARLEDIGAWNFGLFVVPYVK